MKLFFIIVSSFFIPIISFAACFPRDLSSGMTGEDVLILQQTFNARAETRVSESGSGSLGQETDYFGSRTKQAVIRYQNLFRSEILIPAGLSSGTGFVGPRTRAHLEATCAKLAPSPVPPLLPATSTPISTPLPDISEIKPSSADTEVRLMFQTKYSGFPGDTIHLTGTNFVFPAPQNVVLFGNHQATQVFPQSVGDLAVGIPDIPPGRYALKVNTPSGSSNDSFFVVRDPKYAEPELKSVTPSSAGVGAVLTISGTGFTAAGNEIRSGVGIISSVASLDGTSLSFTLPAGPFSTARTEQQTTVFPIWIYVVNDHGVSGPLVFSLKV